MTTEALILWQQRYGLLMLLLERECRLLAREAPEPWLLTQAAKHIATARAALMVTPPRQWPANMPRLSREHRRTCF